MNWKLKKKEKISHQEDKQRNYNLGSSWSLCLPGAAVGAR